jgi:hypothetical protein
MRGRRRQPETLAQAVDALRPGGSAVLYGPSEKAVAVNTREVVGGPHLHRCQPELHLHFRAVVEKFREPAVQKALEAVRSPEEFMYPLADDLNRALYQAWTSAMRARAHRLDQREPRKPIL